MTSLPDGELRGLAELLAPALELLIPPSVLTKLPPIASGPAPGTEDVARWMASMSRAQLTQLLDSLGDHDRVVAARARLLPNMQGTPGGSAPHVILAGLPLVDRVGIWARLQALHTGTPRILSIRGVRGAGKSYTKWLVLEFCQRLGASHQAIQPFDLDGFQSLEAIAEDLLGTLGVPGPRLPFDQAHTTPRAWARTLARQIFKHLVAPGVARWLVFDHFERTPRTETAIAFFLNLAEQIATVARQCNAPRLVLIDHAVGVPPVARGITVEEEVLSATPTDIAVFVRNCRPQWSAIEHEAEVHRILAKLTTGTTFMEDLGSEIQSLTA